MRNDYYSNSNDYINRWVISYADFVTMLLALFMIMFATSGMSETKIKNVNKSIQKVFSSQTVQNEEKSDETIEKAKEIEAPKGDNVIFDKSGKTIPDGGDGILDTSKIMEIIKQDIQSESSMKILKTERGVVIRLNDTMLFDPASAIIKPEAAAELEKISKTLKKFQNPIVIEGHTDSMPINNEKYPSNWELSTARATNIIKYLTEKQNFSPSRLSAVGYGEYMPVEENTTPQGRAKNRRVDIILLSTNKK